MRVGEERERREESHRTTEHRSKRARRRQRRRETKKLQPDDIIENGSQGVIPLEDAEQACRISISKISERYSVEWGLSLITNFTDKMDVCVEQMLEIL